MDVQTCVSGELLLSRSRHAQLNSLGIKPPISGLMSPGACLHMTARMMGGFAMDSGIYQIRNRVNGKQYIGSAVNLKDRWAVHLSELRHNAHHNSHLQRAFKKYGVESFVFSILQCVEPESLIVREQYFLDTLQPEYNIARIAGRSPMLGRHHTAETKRKISQALSDERHYLYGKHLSEKTRSKMSIANMGKRHPLYGTHLSPEAKQKLSEMNSGTRNARYGIRGELHPSYGIPVSEERKRKISEAWTPERRQKQSERTRRMSERRWGLYRERKALAKIAREIASG